MSGFDPGVQSFDPFWENAKWDYHFALIPKKCEKTNKWIWMQHVAQGTYQRGDYIERHYIDKNEFLMLQLQGGLKNGIH